jgi:hypothetical protein
MTSLEGSLIYFGTMIIVRLIQKRIINPIVKNN